MRQSSGAFPGQDRPAVVVSAAQTALRPPSQPSSLEQAAEACLVRVKHGFIRQFLSSGQCCLPLTNHTLRPTRRAGEADVHPFTVPSSLRQYKFKARSHLWPKIRTYMAITLEHHWKQLPGEFATTLRQQWDNAMWTVEKRTEVFYIQRVRLNALLTLAELHARTAEDELDHKLIRIGVIHTNFWRWRAACLEHEKRKHVGRGQVFGCGRNFLIIIAGHNWGSVQVLELFFHKLEQTSRFHRWLVRSRGEHEAMRRKACLGFSVTAIVVSDDDVENSAATDDGKSKPVAESDAVQDDCRPPLSNISGNARGRTQADSGASQPDHPAPIRINKGKGRSADWGMNNSKFSTPRRRQAGGRREGFSC
jgi:hypothetical protein